MINPESKEFLGELYQSENPCKGCVGCCTYVAIEIEAPGSAYDFDVIVWYLIHQNVSVYQVDGDWYVQFDTKCKNLQNNGLCGWYSSRPQVCRDYTTKDCPRYNPDRPTEDYAFKEVQDVIDYLREERPKIYPHFLGKWGRPDPKNPDSEKIINSWRKKYLSKKPKKTKIRLQFPAFLAEFNPYRKKKKGKLEEKTGKKKPKLSLSVSL